MHPFNRAPDDVAAQVELSRSDGNIWSSMLKGDMAMVQHLLKEDPHRIEERDPVGATPLHMAFLYNSPKHDEIAKWVIEHYPQSITAVYTPSQLYEGENILHIAIVNRKVRRVVIMHFFYAFFFYAFIFLTHFFQTFPQVLMVCKLCLLINIVIFKLYLLLYRVRLQLEMVKWLIKREPRLLEARATGDFFSSGACYFGEYPLLFAACTNQKTLVEYLIDVAHADMSMVDSNRA